MLWITLAPAFNGAGRFAGYMPFGYVGLYGVGAFVTAVLVSKLVWPLGLALPGAAISGIAFFAPMSAIETAVATS